MGERTREALAHVAREGRARSRFVPFGTRNADGGTEQVKGDRRRLVPYEAEQRVLARIVALRDAGQGARRIARALNAESCTNPWQPGRPWSRSAVDSLLRTEAIGVCRAASIDASNRPGA